MKFLSKCIFPLAALALSNQVMAENTYLSPTVEKGLIKVCKTAAKDQLHQMYLTMKKQDWSYRQMSLNVMCNGEDLISFAESYGATKTTARLTRSLGTIKVTDIAALNNSRYDVTFNLDK